jgi:hypothetical protein
MHHGWTDLEYHGWTNRETWAKEAQLANDQALYNRAMGIVKGIMATAAPGSEAREAAIRIVGKTLRSNFAASAAERTAINWQEIAEAWVANSES